LVVGRTADSAYSTTVSPVGLYDLLHIDAGFFFQVIDVLGRVQQQKSFLLEHLNEKMSRRRIEVG
jgi:hypothetical protein